MINLNERGQASGVMWAVVILVIISIVVSGISLMTARNISSSNDEIKDTLDEINQKIGPGTGEQEEEEEEEETEEKTVTVGWLGAIETDQGLASWRLTQLFVEDYNETWRHEDDYPNWNVELAGPFDTAQSTTEGVQVYRTLVGKNPDLIIESAIDDVTMAMMDAVKESAVPHITQFTSAVRTIERVGEDDIYNYFMAQQYDYYHSYLITQQANAVSESLIEQGYPEPGFETTVCMVEDTAYGRGTLEMLESDLPNAGYEILDTIIHDVNTADYAPIYDQIRNRDPDFITVVQSVNDLPPVKQWADLDVGIPLIGINVSAMGPYFWEDSAGEAIGAPSYANTHPYGGEVTSDLVVDLYEKVLDRWGTSRPIWQYTAAQTYISALMAFKAAGQAGGFWDSDARESSRNWATAMEEVEFETYNNGELWNRYSFYAMGEEAPQTGAVCSHNWILEEVDGRQYYYPQQGHWFPEDVSGLEAPLGGTVRVSYPFWQASEGYWWNPDWGPIEDQ